VRRPALDVVPRRGLGDPEGMVRGEREREEEVGEAVRPGEQGRVDRLLAVQRDQLLLGPARDRAGDMEGRGGGRPAGKDEGRERRVLRVEPVDLRLQALDVPAGDRRGRTGRRRSAGKLRLGDEQLVPQPAKDLADVGKPVGDQAQREAQGGAELVVRPVGAEAGGVLRYARTAGQTGRSTIARTGVETRDALASGRPGSSSNGELSPWTGQNEMWSTSLCLAS